MIKVKDILPDYTTPINHFGQICFISAAVGFGSAFIHDSISLIIGSFGYYLIILRTYRHDKRLGVNPFSISFRARKQSSDYRNDYSKQEMQLVTIGGILMVLSFISYGVALYAMRSIIRLVSSI